MKNWNLKELVLLIMACTLCIVLLTIVFGLIFSQIPTTPINLPIREKLIDLLEMITEGILVAIGIKALNDKDKP